MLLSPDAISILEVQRQRHPDEKFVFDLPSSRTGINEKLREMAIEAGINKHIHFHVSRHTWATLALTRGVDIYTVSKLMGHSSVAVTEIYANLVNKKKDEVAGIINIQLTAEEQKKKSDSKRKKD